MLGCGAGQYLAWRTGSCPAKKRDCHLIPKKKEGGGSGGGEPVVAWGPAWDPGRGFKKVLLGAFDLGRGENWAWVKGRGSL